MNIQMLPTKNLYHHPNNPREAYDELEELADSFRALGVLQNLTVVPYSPVDHSALSPEDPDNSYVVIIGNRRLEGALLANLDTVPCVIAHMDLIKQVVTMEVENGMRKDTNPRKQAENYQLMLNLGETVDTIAGKTGFSTTTVRNRLKLLDLDSKKFKKAEDRGATMSDYLALNKIQDIELRNKVLDSIGTSNFQEQLNKAMTREKERKNAEDAVAIVKTYATQIQNFRDIPNLILCASFGWWCMDRPCTVPADKDTVKYYYTAEEREVKVFKQQDKAKLDAEAEERRIAQEAYNKADYERKTITARTYERRRNFIASYTEAKAKKLSGDIVDFSVVASMRLLDHKGNYYVNGRDRRYPDPEALATLLEIPYDKNTREIDDTALSHCCVTTPMFTMLCMAYCMWDKPSQSYIRSRGASSEYAANDELDTIYGVLQKLGYEMSEEERQLQDGCHPIFGMDEQDSDKNTDADAKAPSEPAV